MSSPDNPPADGHTPRYVVGVDGTDAATDALVWAIERAASSGAEVTAVAMWHFPPVSVERPSLAQKLHHETEEVLAAAVAEAQQRARTDREVPVTSEVYQYPAAERLVDMSEHADLVIVGRRSRRGLRHLGSVSERVVAHAHCPVVVIPPR